MKKLVLTLTAVGFSASMFAQTMLTLDNNNGTGGPSATSLGRFFNADLTPRTGGSIHATVLGGAVGGSLTPIASNLQWDYAGLPGVYGDSTFGQYDVAGISPGATASLTVMAWIGNAGSYAAASALEKFYAATGPSTWVDASTVKFNNTTGGAGVPPAITFPSSLDGMPSMVLVVPEPSTLALAGLGAAALLAYRRRNN